MANIYRNVIKNGFSVRLKPRNNMAEGFLVEILKNQTSDLIG
jgi:hypothetical protein